MDNWYYKLFGDEFGPVTFDGLIELAKSQTLSPDDEVRFGETGPWRRAGSMGQLMAHMPSGAHMPSASASTKSATTPNSTSKTAPKSEEPTGWFYQVFGEEFGPFSMDHLIELAKNQTLSVDDQIRFGENGTWRRAGSIGQLMAHLPFQAGKNAFSIELEKANSETGSGTESLFSDDDDPLIDLPIYQPATQQPQAGYQPQMYHPQPQGYQLQPQSFQPPLAPQAPQPVAPMPRSAPPAAVAHAVAPQPVAPPEPVIPVIPDPEPEPVKEDVWWCMISGKEYGPVDMAKLTAWAANGRLLRTDFVRRGLESYILANELPGLFPELPPSAVSTKAEFKSVTRAMPTAAPAAVPTPAPELVSAPPVDVPVSRPATNWGANGGGGGGGFNRPAAPIRRPPSKGGSGDLSKLLKPAIGVVAVLLAGGLIYLLLPYMGESADVKNFKALRAAYSEIQKVRSDDNAPSKEELKKVTQKMSKAVKEVEGKLKGKSAANTKLKSLAKKLQDLGKADLTKVSDAEKTIGKQFDTLAKTLNVK